MATDLKEIIGQLRLERDILQGGGYGSSVHTPWKEERLFRDSITCLNVGVEMKQHPCNECLLYEWVPEGQKGQVIPCHFIPLNERGESIASLEARGDREGAEKGLLDWLNATIHKLEERLADQARVAVGSRP